MPITTNLPVGTFVQIDDGSYGFISKYEGELVKIVGFDLEHRPIHHHHLRAPGWAEIPTEIWDLYRHAASQLFKRGVSVAAGTVLARDITRGAKYGIVTGYDSGGAILVLDEKNFKDAWLFEDSWVIPVRGIDNAHLLAWVREKRWERGLSIDLP